MQQYYGGDKMDLNTTIATLNVNSGAINAIAIVILVVVTTVYAGLTYKLVKIEQEREKSKARKMLNILLAEFKLNKHLLGDLENEVKNGLTRKDHVFLGFRDDGWNTIKNQGGYEYIESIYDKIALDYISLYRISKGQQEWRNSDFLKGLSKDALNNYYEYLRAIEKEHDALQKEISDKLEEMNGSYCR